MFRKKYAVAAVLAAITLVFCAACTPQKGTTDQHLDGEYALQSFTVKVGTGETTLKPEDADAQKYASLLALYGKTFTAKDGVMTFTGTAFPKDMPEEYTVTGENVIFESKSFSKMFLSFTIKDGVATVVINGNGLGLTLVYQNQTKQETPNPDQDEPNDDENGGESGGGSQSAT